LEEVLGLGSGSLKSMDFMTCSKAFKFDKHPITVSRCGYTGEDGFEVSVPNASAENFMVKLMTPKDSTGETIAQCVGLGARDSLRLEAGLCLYGHDLNENVSPIAGMLQWTISKRR